MDTDLREKGVMVVGIRRRDGERLMPPSGTVEIALGDCLFVFGAKQAVNEMISHTQPSTDQQKANCGMEKIRKSYLEHMTKKISSRTWK
jgi:uncharacterized protein with PhoU and TrkA domain